jgi:hypothetical protein
MKTKKEVLLLKQFAESIKEMHEMANQTIDEFEQAAASNELTCQRLRIGIYLITGVFDHWVDMNQEIFEVVAPLIYGGEEEEENEVSE